MPGNTGIIALSANAPYGALAERAIIPVLPGKETFPYVLRVVSEVLSSNGSTSMGSVCGSTLSLLDAGVPLKAPVSGTAMGLIKEGKEVRILTDIQGIEDFLGDMDFKVAGNLKIHVSKKVFNSLNICKNSNFFTFFD